MCRHFPNFINKIKPVLPKSELGIDINPLLFYRSSSAGSKSNSSASYWFSRSHHITQSRLFFKSWIQDFDFVVRVSPHEGQWGCRAERGPPSQPATQWNLTPSTQWADSWYFVIYWRKAFTVWFINVCNKAFTVFWRSVCVKFPLRPLSASLRFCPRVT